MLTSLALVVGGLAVLTLAADRFVTAAIRLSRAWGLSPVVIGALVVGFGTSAPEMMVSGLAGARGEIDIAVGNVVGSNTVNLTLVLGSAAVLTPLAARLATIRREGILMLVAMAVSAALLWDLRVQRWEAAVLAVGMVVAVALLLHWARRDAATGEAPLEVDAGDAAVRPGIEAVVGAVALGLTLGGADLLVRGASRLAEDAGISSAFVGVVIVSLGTSLPELATALAAARRRQADLVIGNVLGSNLFNALAVMGVAGLVGPGSLAGSFRPALALMVAAAAVAGVLMATGQRLVRWEGLVLLAMFLALVVVAL